MNRVQSVLNRAKDTIADCACWCKSAQARDAAGFQEDFDSPIAVAWDMNGAIKKVELDHEIRRCAADALIKTLGQTASYWQNLSARTHSEVIDAFDRAIVGAA